MNTNQELSPSVPAKPAMSIAQRFRGFLPVIVDVETAGFDNKLNALLEIGACFVDFDSNGKLAVTEQLHYNIRPFEGAQINQKSCEYINIDPYDPNRQAEDEKTALRSFCKEVSAKVKQHKCKRAIMVAHNAHFDHGFIFAAVDRIHYKRNPFHPFSCFDSATLAGLFYGQTVLSKACAKSGIIYDNAKAHGALYDAQITAQLFCNIVNGLGELFDQLNQVAPYNMDPSEEEESDHDKSSDSEQSTGENSQ